MPVQPNAPNPPKSWNSPGSVPPPPLNAGQNGHRPRVLNNLDRFWQRVTDGLELNELWSQFSRDAQSGYKFYQKDFDTDAAAGMSKGKVFLQRAKAFMWAVLEKLSPARRVMLLVGVVLLILPSGGVHPTDQWALGCNRADIVEGRA